MSEIYNISKVDPNEIILKLKRLIQYFESKKLDHDEKKLANPLTS